MPTIHLIDGEKGGVGKSFVTRAMIQYGLDRNLPFIAVETDRSNPDVAAVYKDLCQFAVLSENEKQADDAEHLRVCDRKASNCVSPFSGSPSNESLD